MKLRKVNIDKVMPSMEEIAATKKFDQLLMNAGNQQTFLIKKFLNMNTISISTIGVVGLVVGSYITNQETEKNNKITYQEKVLKVEETPQTALSLNTQVGGVAEQTGFSLSEKLNSLEYAKAKNFNSGVSYSEPGNKASFIQRSIQKENKVVRENTNMNNVSGILETGDSGNSLTAEATIESPLLVQKADSVSIENIELTMQSSNPDNSLLDFLKKDSTDKKTNYGLKIHAGITFRTDVAGKHAFTYRESKNEAYNDWYFYSENGASGGLSFIASCGKSVEVETGFTFFKAQQASMVTKNTLVSFNWVTEGPIYYNDYLSTIQIPIKLNYLFGKKNLRFFPSVEACFNKVLHSPKRYFGNNEGTPALSSFTTFNMGAGISYAYNNLVFRLEGQGSTGYYAGFPYFIYTNSSPTAKISVLYTVKSFKEK